MPGPDFALAEFELYHSRPIAPTRRLALGLQYLPANPPPGPGGILLGGIVARYASVLDDDDIDGVDQLTRHLEEGRRIVQPRLRHRLQHDRVGLLKTHHRLVAEGDGPRFVLGEGQGSPLVNVLGAAYAAARLPPAVQPGVFETLRLALRWQGSVGPELLAELSGGGGRHGWMGAATDPVTWALEVLGFAGEDEPSRREVRRRFREQLRRAHPDHGGEKAAAADRIADLAEARRILLGA